LLGVVRSGVKLFYILWLPDMLEFVFIILHVAVTYKFSVTSWIRTPKRNKHVGGHPHSKHLLGLAVDIVPDDPDDKAIIMLTFRKLGLMVLDEGDHIHVQV